MKSGGRRNPQSGRCPHGRQKSICYDCGGTSICVHQKRRTRCMVCGGGSMCKHGRRKSRCKEEECGELNKGTWKSTQKIAKSQPSCRRVSSPKQELKVVEGATTPTPLLQRDQSVTPERDSAHATLLPECQEVLPRFSFHDSLDGLPAPSSSAGVMTTDGAVGTAFPFLAAPVAQPFFLSVVPSASSAAVPDPRFLLWSRWQTARLRQAEAARRQDHEARAWEQLSTLFEDIPL